MSHALITHVLGWLAGGFGCAMALAPLLQARRILTLQSANDVSATFLLVIATGAGLYALWGLSMANWFLFTPNALGVLTNGMTIALARHYQRRTAVRVDGQALSAPAA